MLLALSFGYTQERHLSVFLAFSIISTAYFSLPQVTELSSSPDIPSLAFPSAFASAPATLPAEFGHPRSEPPKASHPNTSQHDRQRETEGMFQARLDFPCPRDPALAPACCLPLLLAFLIALRPPDWPVSSVPCCLPCLLSLSLQPSFCIRALSWPVGAHAGRA